MKLLVVSYYFVIVVEVPACSRYFCSIKLKIMSTEIILQITRPDDLSALIAFLEKSGIAFRQRLTNGKSTPRRATPKKAQQKKAPLAQYIGSAPTLDLKSFEEHLHQMRSEWERDTF